VNSNFTVSINKTNSSKIESVEHQGLRIDEKSNWYAHTQEISLQLAKCCKCYFKYVIKLWYLGYSCSKVFIWGRSQTELFEPSPGIKYSPTLVNYTKTFFFKLNDLYKIELDKFMHKLYNDKRFFKIVKIHLNMTRKLITTNYFLPRVTKSVEQTK